MGRFGWLGLRFGRLLRQGGGRMCWCNEEQDAEVKEFVAVDVR